MGGGGMKGNVMETGARFSHSLSRHSPGMKNSSMALTLHPQPRKHEWWCWKPGFEYFHIWVVFKWEEKFAEVTHMHTWLL